MAGTDDFSLSEEPAPVPVASGQWRLTARDHANKCFATPPGGIKFAMLQEAKDHADAQFASGAWRGFTAWVLNDNDGETNTRQPDGQWVCTRRGDVGTWMRGKWSAHHNKLGPARVDGGRR